MSSFSKIADGLQLGAPSAELEAASDLWLLDTSRQRKVRCQRHTRNIFLRAAKKPLPAGTKNANDVHESIRTRAAERFPLTLGLLRAVAEAERGTLGRATLVALPGGRCVYPHRDAGAYYRARDRYHLVLHSPEGSPLQAGDQTVVLREGELWVFNNKLRHSASNPTPHTRVHLIFDLLPLPGCGHYVCI